MIKKTIERVSNFIESVQFWFCLLIILGLTLLIFLQVILRYVLNTPIIWSHEISSGLLIWLTFMGAAVLTKRKQHLRVDIVINYLPEKFKIVIEYIFQMLILVFAVFLIIFSYQLFFQQMNQGMGSLGLPRAYYFSLPVLVFSVSVFLYSLEALFTTTPKKIIQ